MVCKCRLDTNHFESTIELAMCEEGEQTGSSEYNRTIGNNVRTVGLEDVVYGDWGYDTRMVFGRTLGANGRTVGYSYGD